MRRLVKHALAATGISVLTAGAVVTGLTTGSPAQEMTAVAAPLVATSARAQAPSTITAKPDQRFARDTRGTERAPLTTGNSAVVRGKVLLTQRTAIAKEESALEKKKAEAEKKKAEAAKKKAAAEKKAREAEKKAAEKRKREAAARKKAEREKAAARAAAKVKRQGYNLDTTSPKAIARQIMQSRYGWGSKQFNCYNNIIMRESMWKVSADNPTSSAYGIPQALPGSKMASAGPDWRTNPATQIKWGLGYVKSRYGTPCSAWGFKSSHGWY